MRHGQFRETIAETNQVSQRSLDRYLRAYHNQGFNGLLPEGKNPEAKYKIPADIVAAAIQLRRELPSRSIPTIIEILEMEGKVEKEQNANYPVIYTFDYCQSPIPGLLFNTTLISIFRTAAAVLPAWRRCVFARQGVGGGE